MVETNVKYFKATSSIKIKLLKGNCFKYKEYVNIFKVERI